MTFFLAGVADPAEAETAIACGADIVDAEDPARGALAALSPDGVADIVARVAGRRRVSAILGDLPMDADRIVDAARRMAATGIDYLKIALFPAPTREACIRALAPLAQSTKLIGVMFADRGPDRALVSLLAQAGFAGAMIDTADKGQGRLLDHFDLLALVHFVNACRAHGLLAGLAGSLEAPDVARLVPLASDFLGFRGALCGSVGRGGRIDGEAARRIRDLIPREPVALGSASIDYRVLAARCVSNPPGSGGEATDRTFVHDFVLPVRIGTYARERDIAQRVRFNVDIDLARLDRVAEDMRDVLSYDVVTDGIAMIVAAGHVDLVETLAERVAALVLAHPRVVRVTVRVEKLDIRPGSVGVEIVRERAAGAQGVLALFPSVAAAKLPKRSA
jgi:dihydroneopterin aldolase